VVKLFKKKDDKEKSLKKIRNWYQDRYETVMIQRNVLFIIVAAMIGIFALTILGIIELNSKKVYEPFIVQIEETTGVITKVNSATIKNLPAEKSVRNASLVRYILARESYNYADFRFNYNQIVRLMSSKDVYGAFNAMISTANPESPVPLGYSAKVEIRIKSLIDLDEKDNLVQIRVEKAKIPTNVSNEEEYFKRSAKSYIITLKYQYRDLDLSETERYINPLGMQVTAYNITEEINAKGL
jgi:type IV secretion system protein VirB8